MTILPLRRLLRNKELKRTRRQGSRKTRRCRSCSTCVRLACRDPFLDPTDRKEVRRAVRFDMIETS